MGNVVLPPVPRRPPGDDAMASLPGGMARGCPKPSTDGGMEAAAAAEARRKALERAVNRWTMLFYSHQAMQAFRAGRRKDFRQLRDVIYDWTIDAQTKSTPLESAILLLEKMQKEFDMNADMIEKINKKIKEAAVIACFKNQEYEQARKILKRHMSKDPSTQNMRMVFQTILQEKNFAHPAIWKFSYERFQQTVLMFLEDYVDDSDPFLLMMVQKNSADKMAPQLNPVGGASEEMEVSEFLEKDTATFERRIKETSRKDGLEGENQDLAEERPETLEESTRAVAGQTKAALHYAGEVSESTTASKMNGEASRIVVEPAAEAATPTTSKDSVSHSSERPTSYGLSVLKEAFKALSASQDPSAVFQKLDETDWTCPKLSQRSGSHRTKRQREEEKEEMVEKEDSRHPTSGTKSLQKTKHSVTISRFLFEKEDKDGGCRDPAVKQILSKQLVVRLDRQKAEPKNYILEDSQKSPRSAEKDVTTADQNEEKEVWSDEDELFDQRSKGRSSSNTSIAGSKRKMWTSEESQWIKAGVKKFGEGNWKTIFRAYPFKERTPVMIKDRWRTMKKHGIL
ncbi:hypothetical protein JD844_000685 [Phrynosoma platyrhinos]|uniref:Telomeric repeat-binding factor n=1 Tax=Phrynosoma platyrhinos TaxID=52577 RepID=A0ABQ7SQY5_PHRPL|nr:hypothetical protein JD844_000685 [Phrynosoma platyrhinos]